MVSQFKVLIFLCIFLVTATAVAKGPLEALSEQAYKLTGNKCESKSSASSVTVDPACEPQGQSSLKKSTRDIGELSAATNDSAVDHYFALLGEQQVKEFRCAADYAKSAVADLGKDFANSEMKGKLVLAKEMRQSAQALAALIVRDPKLATPACPGNFEALEQQYPKGFKRGDNYKACKELISYRQSYQAIVASVPLSGSPAVSQMIEKYAAGNAEISNEQLRDNVIQAYQKTQKEFAGNSDSLAKNLKENGGAGLGRNERHELLQDPALSATVLKNYKAFSDIACVAEARYGEGADQLNNALMVGSFAFSSGAVIVGKFGALTVRAFNISKAARTTGLISSNAMNILKNTAGAVDMASMLAVADQACFKKLSEIKSSGACVSAPTAEKVEHDSCLLAASLTVMGVVPQSAVGFLAKRSAVLAEQRRLIRMKVTNPKTPVEKQLVEGKFVKVESTKLGAFGAQFVKYEDGTEGVWKPSVHSYRAHNDTGSAEVAAYQVDHYLGLNSVPVTVRKEYKDVPGTVQYRVKKLLTKTEYDGDPVELGFFDYLTANADRHGANYLQKADGKIVAIDHGLAFADGKSDDHLENFKYWVDELAATVKEVETKQVSGKALAEAKQKASEYQIRINSFAPSDAVVEKLRKVDDWKKIVGDNLTDVQIEELEQRRKDLLKAFDYAEQKIGKDRLYPAGPHSPLLKRD